MDFVPFEFGDSVGHLLSENALKKVVHLDDELWSNSGSTHQEKRCFYEVTIHVSDKIKTFSRPKDTILNCSIGDVKNPDYAQLNVRLEFYELKTGILRIDESLMAALKTLFTRGWVCELTVRGINGIPEKIPDFLWKQPVRSLDISWSPQHIVNFHLCYNPQLEYFYTLAHDYDFMNRVIETWKEGEPVQVKVTNKRFWSLRELGFRNDGCYQTEIFKEVDGNEKKLHLYVLV